MTKKDYGLTREEVEDPKELLVRIAEKHPIELEERIVTLDKPLILECACPGWQPKFWGPPEAYPVRKPLGYEEGGVRYPAVPCEIEEQAETLVEAVKAGTAVVHVHPRDPKDCLASHNPELLKAIYDRVFQEVDAIPIQHIWQRTDNGHVTYSGSFAKGMLTVGNGT